MVTEQMPRFAATVAALARPGDLRALPIAALHLVMAMRLRGLFEHAGRDPAPELATRLGSFTAALATLELTDAVVSYWPERFIVNRPCCLTLSPDEATLAALARAARAGNSETFSQAIDGLVRADRHDRLFGATVAAVAALEAAPTR